MARHHDEQVMWCGKYHEQTGTSLEHSALNHMSLPGNARCLVAKQVTVTGHNGDTSTLTTTEQEVRAVAITDLE